MKNRIFAAIASMLLMVSCLEEPSFNNVEPTPGHDVAFSARMSNPETKTLYGVEVSDEDGKSVKLKWVHDDKITVYGTTCAEGRKQAEYAVKTYVKTTNEDGTTNITDDILEATPNTSDGQNFADDLVKTGAAGVQWGDASPSDFYAIYPSVKDGAFTTIENVNDCVYVKTSIGTTQYLSFNPTAKAYQGIPYDNATKKYGMNNAIMYACTPGKTPEEATIDLTFIPFSTVLKFSIPTWYGKTGSNLHQQETGKSLIVKSIKLTAPKKVFGEFSLQLKNDGTASVLSGTEGTSNEVTIIPSEQLKWEYGKSLEFSVFAIPLPEVPMLGWEVAIDFITTSATNQTSEITKTFTLKNTVKKLEDGQIHNVALKEGFPVDAVFTPSPETWLETVPRNVYISDLSLPGAWYATDDGYQAGSLDDQYKAGIRAFNIDCRLTLAQGLDANQYSTNRVYVDKEEHVTDGTLVLVCAGTEESTKLQLQGTKITDIGKTLKSQIINLGNLIDKKPNEYVELIITVAQKPKENKYTLGNVVFGTVNAKMMLAAITQVLNDAEVKPYLFGGQEGEVLTPNTTLAEVAGKVVVKVNVNTSDSNIRKWKFSAPMLISEGSMAESDGTADNFITAATFNQMNKPLMYWSNTYKDGYNDNGIPTHTNGAMYYYYHQAQNTSGSGDFPDIAQRKKAILEILSSSHSIYKGNTHDAMFQLGIGGWTGESNSEDKNGASKELKPFVYNIINSMLKGEPYDPGDVDGARVFEPAPVGAVLMNHATAGETHNTQDLIDAIIELNGRYFLNRDEDKPEWPK